MTSQKQNVDKNSHLTVTHEVLILNRINAALAHCNSCTVH